MIPVARDIGRVHFFGCFLSAQRRWSEDEIAAQLMELSPKARENGEFYARLTARNAAAAASRDVGSDRGKRCRPRKELRVAASLGRGTCTSLL